MGKLNEGHRIYGILIVSPSPSWPAAVKKCGIHFSEEPEVQIEWANKGANIILQSSDISLFGKALNNDISKIKEALGKAGEISDFQAEII